MVATGARILAVLAMFALLGLSGGARAGRGAPPTRVVIEGRASQDLVVHYDPREVTVWRDAARSGIVALGARIEDLGGRLAGDIDGDGQLTLGDFLVLQGAYGARKGEDRYTAAADLNGDDKVDVADVQLLTQAMTAPLAVAEVYVDVRRRGVKMTEAVRLRSSDDALHRPDPGANFGPFPPVSIDPTSGRAGTAVTITMGTSPPTWQFDAQTTATWQGRFVPLVGDPSPIFQVTYSAAQFREFSQGQARIVIGDGSFIGAPDPETLEGPGSLNGSITLHLSSGIDVQRSFSFGLETDAATWEYVDYPDGFGGIDPAQIDGEVAVLEQLLLSLSPDPMHPSQETLLKAATDAHYAAVVRIAENPTTLASAPATILVDLVSYSPTGAEVHRVEGLSLLRVDADGDPNNITYHNDLTKPIVLLDTLIDQASYPDLIVFLGTTGGSAANRRPLESGLPSRPSRDSDAHQ